MRIALNVVAVLGCLIGAVWFLQGVGILPGSFMTGQPEWSIYGGLLVLLSFGLLLRTKRRRPRDG
jgi:LPXTG-motif cell wall-anchored protein